MLPQFFFLVDYIFTKEKIISKIIFKMQKQVKIKFYLGKLHMSNRSYQCPIYATHYFIVYLLHG